LGYEVGEQLDGTLPDAIMYPTGGGVGLIGMWKAFEEMEELGWIAAGTKRPKMIVVQAAGCAPIPKAWEEGKAVSEPWKNASTMAAGLRVPKAYADYIVLDVLKESGGAAVTATDDEILAAVEKWASQEGIFAAPEGAASLVAYEKLIARKFLKASDRVVLFNTGSGIKYVDVIAASKKAALPSSRNIGGIIGPY
jgi:threonine synthase